MIVCDASVLIGWLDSTDAHHAAATELLGELADEDLGCATLTIAEVLVGAYRCGRGSQALNALAGIGLSEIGIEGLAPELAQLRAEVSLPMPDCCVLLAARTRAPAPVLSFDAKLSRVARSIGLITLPA